VGRIHLILFFVALSVFYFILTFQDWNSAFKEFMKYHCCMSKTSYISLCYGLIKKLADGMSEERRKKLVDETIALHNEIKVLPILCYKLFHKQCVRFEHSSICVSRTGHEYKMV
jgi:hypothetical protein